MRALLMNDTTVLGAHTNDIFCGQTLGSLVDENSSPLPPFCVLPERLILIHRDVCKGAGPVFHALDICFMRDITPNTPPQVDSSAYRDRKVPETRMVGEWERRSFALGALSRLLYFSVAKEVVLLLAPDLVASYVVAEDILLVLISFRRLFTGYIPGMHRGFLFQQRLVLKPASYERNCSSSRSGFRIKDVQMNNRLDPMYGSSDVRRGRRPTVSKRVVGSLSEEDQKENGKQPKPGKLKPEKPNPEKPKPERKGDKGSRRVKRPKVQGRYLLSYKQKKVNE